MCRYELIWGIDRLVILICHGGCIPETSVCYKTTGRSISYFTLYQSHTWPFHYRNYLPKHFQLQGIGASSNGGRVRKWSKLGATKHDTALLKMAGLLLGYFTLVWLPTQVFVYISTLCPDCYINDYIRYCLSGRHF